MKCWNLCRTLRAVIWPAMFFCTDFVKMMTGNVSLAQEQVCGYLYVVTEVLLLLQRTVDVAAEVILKQIIYVPFKKNQLYKCFLCVICSLSMCVMSVS